MRPFESSTEYPIVYGSGSCTGGCAGGSMGLNRRRSLFSHGLKRPPPTLYMVPTTPSKPAFLMKPNTSTYPSTGSSDFSRFSSTATGLSNLPSTSLVNPNKFERFPSLINSNATNFASPFEPSVRPWYVNEDAYLDENARNARKLLNEMDIKSKMKKYDANELFNTEILDQLETKSSNEPPPPPSSTSAAAVMTNFDRYNMNNNNNNYDRELLFYPSGHFGGGGGCSLHRPHSSSLHTRGGGGGYAGFQSSAPMLPSAPPQSNLTAACRRINHFYQNDGLNYPNAFGNGYSSSMQNNYFDDFRSYL